MSRRYDRIVMRDLRKDRRKLFLALEELANIRPDADGWAHFRKRWPNFFPELEYDKLAEGQKPSIFAYSYWLDQIWRGGETEPYLLILLGIDSPPEPEEEGTPEDSWIVDLASIPAQFSADWDEGIFRYQGTCDFQRALYLLFLDSWRARVCEKCGTKFIAARAAQKFCSTDCSAAMQREFRRRWWAEHGAAWRKKREVVKLKMKGGKNVTGKTR
ncbi:MAG TPA: hypothetical protein VI386_10880 [Candidatus Sulfotelmatobacter sp.]